TKRINDTTWEKAVNLGYPINTVYDEASLSLTGTGQTMYFSSDRDSAAGNFDIYYVNLPPSLQPTPVTFVKGFVKDSFEKRTLNYVRIIFQDAKTGEELQNFLSNKGDGSYMVTLPVGKRYAYNIGRFGFKDIYDTIDLVGAYPNETFFEN